MGHRHADADAIMDDVERGEDGEVRDDDWGHGDENWGEEGDSTAESRERQETRRMPMPPQSVAYTSMTAAQARQSGPTRGREHRLREANWASSIFRNTIMQGVPAGGEERRTVSESRESRQQEDSQRSTELVSQVQRAGLDISYRFDDEIPWDARTVIEDLMFELAQRANEVSHLQKKADNLQRMTKVRKRERSEERDCPPMKKREPSKGDGYGTSSPNTEASTAELRMRADQWTIGEPRATQSVPPTQPRAARPTQWVTPTPARAEPERQGAPPQRWPRDVARRGERRGRGGPQQPAVMINGREYEGAVKVSPPGPFRPEPQLLQRPATIRETTPPPASMAGGGTETRPVDDYYNFSESDSSDGGEVTRAPARRDDRDLTDSVDVPPLWGVVRVEDWGGVPGRPGYERDNSLRGMLSRDAYHSRRSNMVFVGLTAQAARTAEGRNSRTFRVQTVMQRHQAYDRTIRGIPMNPEEVKKLLTVVNDQKGRFSERERAEAWMLLRELYSVAQRVMPESRDRSMEFLLEPGKFDMGSSVSQAMEEVSRGMRATMPVPPRQQNAPPLNETMMLDAQALYLLYYNRPGSGNPVMGIDMDHAYRVGRRTVFGYALGRLMAPIEREAMHAFRRQYALLVALPRRYREAIVEHDRANPQHPFTPQGGPVFTIHRVRRGAEHAANMSRDDVLQALLDNRVPPEWVDHAYGYGVSFINAHYGGTAIDRALLDNIDNERLERLRRFGAPPEISLWGGWRHPSEGEIRQLHAIVAQEEARESNRPPGEASARHSRPESSSWLLMGQTGLVTYLTRRPQLDAERYASDNQVIVPSYSELETTTMTAASGNPLAEPPTADEVMAVNTADDPMAGAPSPEQVASSDVGRVTLSEPAPDVHMVEPAYTGDSPARAPSSTP